MLLTIWKVVLLGIIQGLTEFLPISSSGHLALAQFFFGIEEPQLFFDVMLHVGTLGAIIVVYARDIGHIIMAVFGREPKKDPQSLYGITKKTGRKLALLIILGSIPTVIVALIFSLFVEKLFVSPLFVSLMLVVTGFILWYSGRFRNINASAERLNFLSALIIGAVQGLATLPGISRSGSTISAAVIRGINREEAARYSLLLSIPAIIGATLLELRDINNIQISITAIISGTVVAFIVGFVSIKLLLKTLKTGIFSKFAYYCWIMAVLSAAGYLIKTVIS
ncbi:hypothetical protein GF312_17120 [Candidatus Poribacteria bacterium]|nr:hypothetical protein [Candidatus Poribacteria bacterium]